jgi:FkbM family methyltransferase
VGSENVYTFEANANLEPMIQRTYRLNKVSPKYTFCMLGERVGQCDFFVSKNIWASSAKSKPHSIDRVKVRVWPFNEVMQEIKPNYLIIDIEGGEAELFRYADLSYLNKICIELHPYAIGADAVAKVIESITHQGFKEDSAVSDQEHKLFIRQS